MAHSISHVIEQDVRSGEEYTRAAVFRKAYTSKYLFLIPDYSNFLSVLSFLIFLLVS